ncbi:MULTISPECIES: hypothetical protein [Ramlibacter]|uniref:Uncharacterized protein n=1 Tax=Ramlibacter aquaticus TaxID=2780094 RepID=A0ABR9SCS0_9BURK|nr:MULTISPECIES: hypothetical protein [Ramlibacter]MBE7939649.1 hypothetical protein [Ramlibacter aquaticus]
MRHDKVMWIVWPAFLAACVLELVVFAVVDPSELHLQGWPRQAVYTAAFFAFWAVCAGASGLTALLGTPPSEVNRSA